MHGGKGTHGSLVFKKLDLKVKAGLTLVSFIPYWAGLSTLSPPSTNPSAADTGRSFWSVWGYEGKCSWLREAVQRRVRTSSIRKQASNSVQAVVSGADSDSQ